MVRETPPRPRLVPRLPARRSKAAGVGVIGPITSGGVAPAIACRLMCFHPLTSCRVVVRCMRRARLRPVRRRPLCVRPTPAGVGDGSCFHLLIHGCAWGRPTWGRGATASRTCAVTALIHWIASDDVFRELAAVDPLTDEVLCRQVFDDAVLVDLDMAPATRPWSSGFPGAVVDVDTGKLLLDQRIARQPAIEQIHLMASDDNFALAVEHPPGAIPIGRCVPWAASSRR